MLTKPPSLIRALLLSLAILAAFWVFDSVVDAYVFHEGNVLMNLLLPGAYELYIRTLVGTTVAVLVIFMQRAARQLAESEARFRSAIDYAPIGMSLVGLDGRWLQVNRALCDIVGYSEAELLRLTFQDITHPDDLEADLANLHSLLAGEIPSYHMEKRYFRKDRRIVWILLSVSLVRDTQGTARYLISQVQDITERRQAEAALRLSDERFQLVSYATNHAVWDWNLLTGDIWRSATFQGLFGYTSEEVGTSHAWWQEHIHPAEREKVAATLRAAVESSGGFWSKEYRFRRADGSYAHVFDRGYVLSNEGGQPARAIGAMMDITDRKQLEETLHAAEIRFRTLVEQIPAITYLGSVGGEQNTLYISPQIETILGFTPQEWIADSDLWRKQIHPDDRARVLAVDQQSTATGEPFLAEYRIYTKDGRLRWLHDETRRVSDESGQSRLYLGLEFDVTERRETEEALRQSTENYRQMFEEAERLRQFNVTVAETMAEGLTVEDPDGRLTLVNPKLCALLGYTAAELQGQNWSLIVAPGARAEIESHFHLRPQGVSSTYESRLLAKDGREIPVLISAAPFARDGQYQGTVATLVDISEQKRGEAALQEAKTRLESLVRQMEQRTQAMAQLTEMGDMLQASLAFEEAYAVIRDVSRRLFHTLSGALCILNASRNLLETAATWGVATPPDLPFAPDACWAVRRGRPHLVEIDHPELLCPHARGAASGSTLCVPLLAQGEALGVFTLRSDADGISADMRQLAETVADRVSLALANLRLRETMRQQSIRDPLTNLFNRRYLEETLERETQRAARRGLPLGIIMLDIDHFKTFNDTFGHAAGDALLRELGAFLRLHVRQEDIPCRYGGEEFTLILPEATRAVTRQRAETLCQEVAQLRAQHAGQPLGAVTLSLGVAVFPDQGATGETVLRAADAALYAAKRLGRNRVAVAGE